MNPESYFEEINVSPEDDTSGGENFSLKEQFETLIREINQKQDQEKTDLGWDKMNEEEKTDLSFRQSKETMEAIAEIFRGKTLLLKKYGVGMQVTGLKGYSWSGNTEPFTFEVEPMQDEKYDKAMSDPTARRAIEHVQRHGIRTSFNDENLEFLD